MHDELQNLTRPDPNAPKPTLNLTKNGDKAVKMAAFVQRLRIAIPAPSSRRFDSSKWRSGQQLGAAATTTALNELWRKWFRRPLRKLFAKLNLIRSLSSITNHRLRIKESYRREGKIYVSSRYLDHQPNRDISSSCLWLRNLYYYHFGKSMHSLDISAIFN